ncbi:MAG TPA: hypothetical protein VIE36_09635 [Methylomirabilota bacterium]|jgi:hypothetical protein
MIRRSLALALAVLALAGCASGQPSASASSSNPPRARCLVDPNEGGTRPLIYFLCIESP